MRGSELLNPKVVVKEVQEEKAIKSATQTGIKTISVTTNFDATNSTVKVTRGNNAVATDKVSFSEDGKTITILTTATIVAAEYTVTVDDLTKNFTGETSKVAKIEILSDLAAVEKDPAGKYTQATVGYKVTNQFEDDITKTTTLTVNSSASKQTQLDAKNHLIRFYSNTEYMIGRDLITVVLLDSNNTGVSANKTLTVSMEAFAKEVTYEGLYNADNKTLTEDTDLTQDTFYALFSAVDQYDNQYKSYKNVEADKDLFVSVMGGLTSLTKKSGQTYFTVIEKDGKTYLAYPLAWTGGTMTPVAGEATVQLLSSGGASCTGTITVEAGTRVDTITVTDPVVLAAGTKTDIPFTATDASGKEVKAYKVLKDVKINNGAASELKWVKNTDGTGKLVLDATGMNVAANSPKIMTFTFTTPSQKFYNKQLTITENARPVAIDGIQGVSTTVSKSKKEFEIKLSNLKIEDQYGNVMDGDALDKAVKSTSQYTFGLITTTVLYNKDNNAALKLTNYDGKDGNGQPYKTLVTSDLTAKGKDTVIAKLAPNVKGEVTIEFAFANGCGTTSKDYVKDSANVMFTVKDTSNVEEATATVGTVYAVADSLGAGSEATDAHRKAYEQEVKVVAGGAQLGAAEYTLSLPNGLVEDSAAPAKDNVRKIYYSGAQNDIKEFKDGTATTVTKTIKITLNGTGETFTQDVTISKEAPYAASVALKAGKSTYEVPATATPLNNANVLDYCIDNVKDQYGVKLVLGNCTTITFANGTVVNPIFTFQYKSDSASVTNNGTTSAQLTPNTGFDAATMLVAFGKNVDEKAVAEINLVKASGATESNPALADFKTAFNNGSGVNTKIVKAIDASAQLSGGTKWGDLKNVDKLAIVSGSSFVTDVEANSDSAVKLNAVVKAAAVSASAFRTEINKNDAIIDLLAGKTVTLNTTTLKPASGTVTAVTASAIVGTSIFTGNGANDLTINAPTTASAGDKAQISITYSPSVTGYTESFKEYYTIEAVKDIFTGELSYKVTYVDATL